VLEEALRQPRPSQARSDDVGWLARAGMLNLATLVVQSLAGFALIIVVTRGLHAHGAGVFFEVVGLFMILANGAEMGADTGLVRAVARSRALGAVADVRRLIGAAVLPVLACGLLVAAATWAVAPWLASVFLHGVDQEDATASIRLLALFVPLQAATIVVLSGTRGFDTMVPYVLVENLGKPLSRLALLVLVLAAGFGASAALTAWAAPIALGFLVAVAALARLLGAAERTARIAAGTARSARELAGEFWRFAAPRGLAGVFQIAAIWLNVLLVGALRSPREAGIYAAVSKLAMIGTLVMEAVRLPFAPQISGLLARGERDRARTVYQVGTSWMVAACWPLYLLFAIFGTVVLQIFGSEFSVGYTALLVLSLAMLLNVGTGSVTVLLLMAGKSSWNVFNTVAALAVNVGLGLLLVPRIGITGAAIGWAAGIAVDNLAALVEVWLLLRLHPFGRGWGLAAGQAALCFGGFGLAAWLLWGATLASLAAAAVAASAVYLVLIWRARAVLELNVLVEAVRLRAGTGRAGSRPA
jgi:O-antigen/teichoic acid export membrane protein